MNGWIFPGQGSQAIGMGKALNDAFPAAKAVFDEVNEALSQNLTHIMWEGDIETLTMTANAQPAIMSVSFALVRVLETEFGITPAGSANFVAGHSLGEYSALAAVGSLSLSDTAKLLRIRGTAMQEAVPVGQGAMAALLGGTIEEVSIIARQAQDGEICDVANDNAEGQVVVSGHKSAVERAIDLAKKAGLKRAMLLPVSAPFHCQLMQPAAERMQAALGDVIIRDPSVPVIANVTAAPVAQAADIQSHLVSQVTGRVRWRESVMAMSALGVTQMFEMGHGKVLSGLLRRIDKSISCTSIGDPDSVAAAIENLRSVDN